jgi:TonB-linked SusC/RagA family outer membrane protein
MKRILLLSVVFMVTFSVTWAQRTVTGTVTGADDGTPVPGVNVIVKGTAAGTVTDIDGMYQISVPVDGGILVFSFIGLATEEVEIGNQSTINMVMSADIKQLTEVVVTALGVSREKKALGYAVSEVEGSDLSEARETNIVNSLNGKVAGVQIYGSNGNMGGSSRVIIRGVNSITGNNQPLFVVDGVPVDNSNFTSTNQARGAGGYDYGNAIQDINPDDIQTMSVLKGAAAAALYGTRASNGVILITTKTGKSKKTGIGVQYNLGFMADNVYILPNYQNEYGGGFEVSDEDGGDQGFATAVINGVTYRIPDYAVDESWGPRLNGQEVLHWWGAYDYEQGITDSPVTAPWVAHPNNIRDYYKTGNTWTNNISMTGNNKDGSFRLSYTDMKQDFVNPNSSLKRKTLGFNGGYNLTKKLEAKIGVNYVNTQATGRPGTGYDGNTVTQQFNQWGQRQWDMEKMKDYKNPDGSQRTWNRISLNNPNPTYTDNPFWTAYENYQNDERERVFGNTSLSYEIIDGLKASVTLMKDFYIDRRQERIAIGSQAESFYSKFERKNDEVNVEGRLTYFRNLTDKLSLNAIAGGNQMTQTYWRTGGNTVGGLSAPNYYNLANSNSPANADDYFEKKRINSLFASASLGYNGILYLDLTARNEWSSTLPEGERSYFFPSASTSFIFSELFASQNTFSFGKVRFGYAEVGSDTGPYRLDAVYAVNKPFQGSPSLALPNALNNANLRPEITSELEAGIEMKFFNNRIGFDFTVYSRETRDQIIPLTISGSSGYTSAYINAGLMSNKGYELAFTLTPLRTQSGFNWDMILNLAHNRNKVEKLYDDPETGISITNLRLGSAPFSVTVNATEGEAYGTILGRGFLRDDQGRKLVGNNGAYRRTTDLIPLGNSMADFTGGLTNAFSYKSWSLSALIDYQFGAQVFSTTNMWAKYSGMTQETVDNNIREDGIIVDGVRENGEVNDVVLDAQSHFFLNQGYVIQEADIYSTDYIYLRELKFGYSLPNSLVKKLGLQNAKLSLVGRNLWLIKSDIPHLDPSNLALSAGNVQGIEGAGLPSIRSFGFNLSIGL